MALYYKKSLECVFDLLSENNTWHSSMNWPLGCSAMKMKPTFFKLAAHLPMQKDLNKYRSTNCKYTEANISYRSK